MFIRQYRIRLGTTMLLFMGASIVLSSQVKADLINAKWNLDGDLAHEGSVDITGPLPAANECVVVIGGLSRWGWIVEQSDVDNDGDRDDISVQGFHLVGPHIPEVARNQMLLHVITNVTPAEQPPLFGAPVPHPPLAPHNHKDWFQTRFDVRPNGDIKMTIWLCHLEQPPNPIPVPTFPDDSDDDGIPDACEVDCGAPGGPCDVPGCGQSSDCNANGIPDEFESDCDGDGTIDDCDVEQPEACVVPEAGLCVMIPPECCIALGGTPQGTGEECTTDEGCCLSDGSCVMVDPLSCDDLDGVATGLGTVCLGDSNGNGIDDACESSCGDCPTDVDGSGSTTAFDLAILLGNWGPIPPDADPAVLCLDSDGDGTIAAFDLAVMLGSWGPCP